MILRRVLLLLIVTMQSFLIFAQDAPDFTVTDSWGTTHHLYQDYLDQGKTVVIEVFFADCPPCNAIANSMQPLYQTWGAGQADVQFIELSILQSDTDAKVNTYKSNHNTTYPAVGGQGGSVAAVATYKNGTYGPYTGTPLFVVIAPDKSVNYDVSGNSIPNTIAALNAAIEATGAQGTNTATSEPEKKLPLSLVSNMVEERLMLQYEGTPTSIKTTIISIMGQVYTSAQFPMDDDTTIQLDVSDLQDGIWVLKAQDVKSTAMASYLFVKF